MWNFFMTKSQIPFLKREQKEPKLKVSLNLRYLHVAVKSEIPGIQFDNFNVEKVNLYCLIFR